MARAALPATQPPREGADGDPRDVPARRAVPDPHGSPVRDRDGHPRARRAPPRAAVRAPGRVRALPLVPGLRAARPLPHAQPRAHRGDPARRVRRRERRLRAAPLGVRARPHPLHRADRPRRASRLRRGEDRAPDRRGDARVDRRAPRRADRGLRRGARQPPVPPLRARLPDRLPRRLARAQRGRRHRAHRGARGRRRPRAEPVPPARGARRRAALQALPLGRAGLAVRRAADVREHGAQRRRRAPLRGAPARRLADVDLRLRADLRRRRRARRRRGARGASRTPSPASGTARSRTTASTRWCCAPASRGAT